MDNIAKDYGERFVHRMLPGVAETLPPSNLDEIRDLEHQHYQHYPKPSQKPLFKLDQWYRSIAKTHIEHGAKPKVFSRLAAYYHDKHLIKQEEIPQSYFTRLAKDPAQELGPGWKQEQTNLVIDRQKNSLNKWLKYLTSPQTEAYPIWMKHWVFEGVLKLGALDTQSYEYERRRSTTVAPFPELNSEALANVIGLITKKAQVDSMELAEKKQLAGGETVYPRMDKLKELIPALEEDSKLQRLMNKPNFGRLYAYELEKLNQTQQTKSTTSIDGEWIKFPQGSDHMLLVKAIEDHATGWCTANSSMAEDQLDKGDFHIFFSRDSQGQATIPRIAICMTGEIIAEVRGIAADQNMEAACVDIVAEKLETIPGGHEYQKNIESSKKLDLLEEKIAAGLELDQVDLKFLYEIDGPIAGFGQSDDSRINQIRKTRDVKRDLALVDNLERGEVALSLLDIKPDTRIYYNLASLDADPDANGDKGFRYSRNQYSEGLFKQQIQLNNIFARVNAGERLTADDLLLIYEINGPVVSLGIDPELENPQTIIERYPEIFERRNFLADMFEIKSAYPDLITKIDELMMDHYGELDIGHTESEDILAKLSKKESAGYIYTDSLQIEKLSPGDIFTDLLALEDLEIQGVLHLLGLQYDFDLAAGLIVQDRLDASGSCIQAIGPRTQVSGILDLSSSSIKSLPADIEVSTIDISGSKITELPAGLKLSTLIVRESQIKELPLDIEIKESIFLDPHLYSTEIAREDSPLRNIPRIEMTGDLDLRSAPKPFLPKIVLAIYIEGDLDLTDVGITELPQDSIEVENGSIYLSGNPVSQLPKTIIVGQDLALDYTQITELPENLEVPGDLNLEGTPISILPKGLKVGGDLYIGDTLITDLPDDLEVAGEIIRE